MTTTQTNPLATIPAFILEPARLMTCGASDAATIARFRAGCMAHGIDADAAVIALSVEVA